MTQDSHDILDLAPISAAQPIDFHDLFKISGTGGLSPQALPVLQKVLNNHISIDQASAMMDLVLQNENRNAFNAFMAVQSPATKAIARSLLPSAIRSANVGMVKVLLATKINPNLALNYRHARPLHLAVEMGNVEMTELLLSYGSEVDFPMSSDDCQSSPLTIAAGSGRVDIMRLLLNRGADVNVGDVDIDEENADEHERGPLRAAIQNGHLKAAKLLLDFGANVDTRSFPGAIRYRQVLETAISTGNMVFVHLILLHGAHVPVLADTTEGLLAIVPPHCRQDTISLLSTLGASGLISAIDLASRRGHMKIVRLCSEAGSLLKTDSARACKKMAIKAGVRCGDYQFVQQVLDSGTRVDVDAPVRDGDPDWDTALQWAAERGRLDLVQLLRKFGARLDSPPTAYGWTVLQGAVISENVDLVKYLLESGADVNFYNAESYIPSPLASAARSANLELFQLLQEAGANMVEQGPDALIKAVWSQIKGPRESLTASRYNNSATIIRLLVDHLSSSANSRAAIPFPSQHLSVILHFPQLMNLLLQEGLLDASAALIIAIRMQDLALVTLFLRRDADVNNDPPEGPWALKEAVDSGGLAILHYLLTHGANSREKARALQAATRRRSRAECVRLLLDYEADINADPLPVHSAGKYYRTALQAAAEDGNLELVRLLIAEGAEVERFSAGCNDQGTALQFAAMMGHTSVAYELIQQCANVNALAIGEDGRTALEGAAEHGRLDMVQLLLNLEVETQGSRALRFAKREGHESVVALLLENGVEDVGLQDLWSEDDGSQDDESVDGDYW